MTSEVGPIDDCLKRMQEVAAARSSDVTIKSEPTDVEEKALKVSKLEHA